MSNARLQQVTTLVLLALALVWVVLSLQRGQPAQALWALVLPLVHAPILGLELLWAAMAARRPAARRALGQPQDVPQPYPEVGVWLRAWLHEILASIRTFGWQQPWRHLAYPDHVPDGLPDQPTARATSGRGVLLVHGFVCNRGFWNPWARALQAAGVPFVAVSMEPPFGDIDQQSQALDAAWARLHEATGQVPLLVGHSMGGLAIRSWLSRQPSERARAHEVITIGSPHHGTALAQFASSQAAQQMQLLSPFLQSLAAREDESLRSRWTCYWSVCDNIVFPAHTATLPGARNVCIDGLPHVAMAQAPQILADVLTRVRSP